MAKNIIIDAEWEEIPNSPKPKVVIVRQPRAKKIREPKQAIAKKPRTEGRVDILAGRLLTNYLGNITGAPVSPQVADSIQSATSMFLGTNRASGPEWDFVKQLMKATAGG
jgi:hypothetical protein